MASRYTIQCSVSNRCGVHTGGRQEVGKQGGGQARSEEGEEGARGWWGREGTREGREGEGRE